MSPAISTASSWSSVQSRVITPRSISHSRTAWNEDDIEFSSSSRYRLLDASQKQRETEDVGRIINDLEAQRRYRSPSNRAKRSLSRQKNAVVPIRSNSQRWKDKSAQLGLLSKCCNDHPSFWDMSGRGDKSLPVNQQHSTADAVSQSFQDQVLEELRKLKKAQCIEFEALERLQREKDEAERKAHRLEQKLRDQERQLSRNEENALRSSGVARKIKPPQDVSYRENYDEGHNDKIYSSNNTREPLSSSQDVINFDARNKNDSEQEEEPEVVDWNDVSKSPPPYLTAASPATSPFKRSSGWPAWTGDESLPPGPSSEPQECSSTEHPKFLSRSSRSRSKPDMNSTSRSRPNSAESSHVHRLSQSKSRSPSARNTNRSSQDSQELRPSCAFFEDKARAQAEAEQLEKEKTKRLERACNAAPPQKLLEREALAQQRKSQQRKELEREMRAEFLAKRAKARDVPLATYLSATEAEEAEQKRKERIRQRAQEMMESAELPPRMSVASKISIDTSPGNENGHEVEHMSVKLKKKLKATAEEKARTRRPRPKDVPDFDRLHSKWEAVVKKRKELARRNQDEGTEFFTSRTAKLAELQEKKKERKQRLQAKEEALRQHAVRAKEKLLARTRASLGKDVGIQAKTTKAETLRVQKMMAETTKQQKERQREEREADARERRREEAARRVRAQVKRSENVRRENYAGNFVELKDLDEVAKEKAREQRQQFKEAIACNKEKLLAATAARPSLMERFTTDVKRETHRRAALEAVVKTVFEKDLSTLKGVLTDDEQELAREMIAVDDSDKNSET